MEKMYAGKMPGDDEVWHQIGRFDDPDGVQWVVLKKQQDHTQDWITCKIVADGKAKNKANYWMVKNISTGQIGFPRDYVLMRNNRPELHQYVEEVLEDEMR